MEPRWEFFQNRGIQAAAYVLAFANAFVIWLILLNFWESRQGTWGDLGGAAMNLVFGIPLGIAGIVLAFFAQKRHPVLAIVLGILSLLLVLQLPTLFGETFLKTLPAENVSGS